MEDVQQRRGWAPLLVLIATITASGVSTDLWDPDPALVTTLSEEAAIPPRVLYHAQPSRRAGNAQGEVKQEAARVVQQPRPAYEEAGLDELLQLTESPDDKLKQMLNASKTNSTKCEDSDDCEEMFTDMPDSAIVVLCKREISVRRTCPNGCKKGGYVFEPHQGNPCPQCKDDTAKCAKVLNPIILAEKNATIRFQKCEKLLNQTEIKKCPIACLQECPMSDEQKEAQEKAAEKEEQEKAQKAKEKEEQAKEKEEKAKAEHEKKQKADEKKEKDAAERAQKSQERAAARKERSEKRDAAKKEKQAAKQALADEKAKKAKEDQELEAEAAKKKEEKKKAEKEKAEAMKKEEEAREEAKLKEKEDAKAAKKAAKQAKKEKRLQAKKKFMAAKKEKEEAAAAEQKAQLDAAQEKRAQASSCKQTCNSKCLRRAQAGAAMKANLEGEAKPAQMRLGEALHPEVEARHAAIEKAIHDATTVEEVDKAMDSFYKERSKRASKVTVNREELAKKMADERIGKIVNASAAQAQTDADQAAKRQVKIMHKAYRNEMDKEIEARKSVINATKQADKVKHKAEKEKRKLDKLEADAEDSVRAIDMAKAKKKAVKKEAEETELESKREIERIQDKKTEDMLKIKEEVSDIFQEAQKKANHYHKLAAKFNAELNEAKLKGQAQANATKAAEEEEIKKLDAKSSPAAIIAQAQQGTASKEAKKRHAANLQKRKALIAGQQRKVEAQKKGFQKALKHEAAVFKQEQQQVKAAAQQRKEDSKAEAAATDGERQVHQEMENALNPKPSPQDICTEQCNKECA